MKVLVTGVAGKMGQLVARELLRRGHAVIGIDQRSWAGAPSGIEMHQIDVRKRPAEDVFRTGRPEGVVHMATVSHLTHRSAERFRINLQGTRAVWEHCAQYGVDRAIFVGRHTYYGAAPDSPLYHTEEDPPLAVHSFPELSDLVAADLYAGGALWRYPELKTAVLRVCYTLGPLAHGTLAAYLRGPRVPTVFGFDPLYQFMHEDDVATAICAALESGLRGVFNVAGPDPVPLSVLIRETGRRNLPVPEPLLNFVMGRFGLPRLPRGAVEFMKYPLVIDSSRFRKATGFSPAHDAAETMAAFRRAVPMIAFGRS